MRESYSVKYCEKKKWFELVLGPFTFDGIVDLLGKKQQMNVLQLHLFQDNNEDLNDYELNEDFFSGMSLSLGQFSDILSVIENYEILSLVFEMEEGAQVKMEEGVVSVLVKKSREDLLLKVVTMLNSVNDEKLFQRLAANAYEPANLTNCQGFQPFPVVMDLSWIAIYPN